MSYKTSLIKFAVKCTPKCMIRWVSNFIMKDIAELTDFQFDIDSRKLYSQVQLVGESETIEVWLEDFAILRDGESYQFIIHQAKSNRIWLNNLLARFTGKAFNIPSIPQLAAQMELAAELFNAQSENPKDMG